MSKQIDHTITIELRPVRIFRCEKECKFLTRSDVTKKEGHYFCPCGLEVKDVTNTETGKWALNFIGATP